MKANEQQIGGDHYKDMAIQPIEFITKNNIPFIEGNIIKYICRWRVKGGVEDLKKARHYLDMLIENEEWSELNELNDWANKPFDIAKAYHTEITKQMEDYFKDELKVGDRVSIIDTKRTYRCGDDGIIINTREVSSGTIFCVHFNDGDEWFQYDDLANIKVDEPKNLSFYVLAERLKKLSDNPEQFKVGDLAQVINTHDNYYGEIGSISGIVGQIYYVNISGEDVAYLKTSIKKL